MKKAEIRYCPGCKKNETRSECSISPKYWDKFSIARVHPANEETDPCWKGYKQVGMKKKGKKKVPNCVPTNEETLTSKETNKREDYVKGMKKNLSDFRKRYGKDAKSVMYATATKMAKEEADISFKINHTKDDAREAQRQDKLRKRAASGGQGSDIAAKKLKPGISLPLANEYKSTGKITFSEFINKTSK